jgi:hypothetical protein
MLQKIYKINNVQLFLMDLWSTYQIFLVDRYPIQQQSPPLPVDLSFAERLLLKEAEANKKLTLRSMYIFEI